MLVAPPNESDDEIGRCQLSKDASAVFEKLEESIGALSRCTLTVDVKTAVLELHNFVHNIHCSPLDCRTMEKKLRSMFSIRNWLRFVPTAPAELNDGKDLPLYLYLANYELAMLIMGSLWPALEAPLILKERRACASNMREFIEEKLNSRFLPVPQIEAVHRDRRIFKACLEWLEASEIGIKWYEASAGTV